MKIDLDNLPTLSPDEIERELCRPPSFGYGGNNADMFRSWSLGPVVEHRDSGITDRSNARALREYLESMADLENDWETVSCNHWAVGHVDHLSYRVVDPDGRPTKIARILKAWFTYLKDEYPLADEDLYSMMECDATFENVATVAQRFVRDDAPNSYVGDAIDWFDNHKPSAIESQDDQGGYPSDEDMKECLKALGYLDPSYDESEE